MSPVVLLLIGIGAVLGGVLWLRLHAFLALTLAAFVVGFLTPRENLVHHWEVEKKESSEVAGKMADQSVGKRIAEGFGRTCAKVGLIIAMAAIIGTCLLESGAADRIVRSALKLCGEKRAPYALSGSSFILGIPVFFDTVFYLMIPLAKALASRTGKNYLLYVLAIIAGGSMTHSLVPPTPGPLLVAGELGVDLGQMIIGGLTVGIFGMIGGFAYARWANNRWPMDVRGSEDLTSEDLKTMANRTDDELPNLWLSLAPTLVPVILIAGYSLIKQVFGDEPSEGQQELLSVLAALGDKNLALTLGAGMALWLLTKSGAKKGKELVDAIRKSLGSAGSIILITGMGGAFGGILQQTGIGSEVSAWVDGSGMGLTGILLIAFFVTVVIRIAQGSATVAMITAVGIVGGIIELNGEYWIGYVALAIGCGAKPFPWMNDSGFWVVGRLAGFTEGETLKTFSCIISLLGIIGLAVTLLLANLWPHFIF
jgi:gluconate:H+ symporter, GntP family